MANLQIPLKRGNAWKGGRAAHIGGYVKVWHPSHPTAHADGYTLEHRRVWYDAHGAIPSGHHVHHKNGDKADNHIENLELLRAGTHARHHIKEAGSVENQWGTYPVIYEEPPRCSDTGCSGVVLYKTEGWCMRHYMQAYRLRKR